MKCEKICRQTAKSEITNHDKKFSMLNDFKPSPRKLAVRLAAAQAETKQATTTSRAMHAGNIK
jgi:hypothetical protein